jgi:ribose transport system ATP-binding protein
MGENAPKSEGSDAEVGGPLIEFRGVTKRFGSTEALASVSFSARAGSVHAITGENGAGKSTLMKLLAGVHRPDSGEIYLAGRPIAFHGPSDAVAAGIATIFQELTLVPNLTVAENLFLGREPVRGGFLDRGRMRRAARKILENVELSLDPDLSCGDLTIAEQHLVEIAKGLTIEARVVIYDEPTAALDAPGVLKLERLIERQKRSGALIFYISHRLHEIFRLCDTTTVLKDGRHVATGPTSALTHDGLVTLMVGRELGSLFPARTVAPRPVQPALNVTNFVPSTGRPAVSFQLRRGEIVGLAGLEGQGQREIVRALVGLQAPSGGRVEKYEGETKARTIGASIVAATLAGLGFIPEDRKTEGLYPSLSIEQNIGLGILRGASLFALAKVDITRVLSLMRAMSIRARDEHQSVGSLSGGNQQKVMIGRWLASNVDALVIEEPTRGVDVGAKAEIYALLRNFADQGGAVLITSSELSEHLGLCDRILVVRAGSIVSELNASEASEELIMTHALAAAASIEGLRA